jgi:hypothetical protein
MIYTEECILSNVASFNCEDLIRPIEEMAVIYLSPINVSNFLSSNKDSNFGANETLSVFIAKKENMLLS